MGKSSDEKKRREMDYQSTGAVTQETERDGEEDRRRYHGIHFLRDTTENSRLRLSGKGAAQFRNGMKEG